MLTALNHTFLVLIPKSPSPTTLNDYWLISCIGVVISKIIASRLLTTLPTLITENQFTFIKGRWISDAINLTHEFMHTFNNSGTYIVLISHHHWHHQSLQFISVGLDRDIARSPEVRWRAATTNNGLYWINLVLAMVEGSPSDLFQRKEGYNKGIYCPR